ncbi:hypothetical protein [Pectinatus frisingensis]|jgi:hypothetical protein|uniref:hypothetical protein n=1 Tax=Pectinatus frisingensis TaxID=865 RepID=UPI0018C5EB7F|nr:hypothetical protein [Pectinatus frisingensis]
MSIINSLSNSILSNLLSNNTTSASSSGTTDKNTTAAANTTSSSASSGKDTNSLNDIVVGKMPDSKSPSTNDPSSDDSSANDSSSVTQIVDEYISSLQMQNNSLANYLPDNSTSDSGLYSVLTYGQDAKVQNIIKQFSDQIPSENTSSGTSSGSSDTSDTDKGSSIHPDTTTD